MFFIKLLFCVILVEGITELVVKTEIFKSMRNRIVNLNVFLGKLIHCGYCFSVWVAFGVVFLINTSYPLTGNKYIDLVLCALIVHRLSNYLHNFNDCWLDKYYNSFRVGTDKSDG